MREPRERLRDVLEAIGAIRRYVGRGRAAFEPFDDRMRQFVTALG